MIAKFIKVFLLSVLAISVSLVFTVGADASTKVMWGKTELKLGQTAKITILANTNLYKLDGDGKLSVARVLKKGEEYRIYGYKNFKGYNDSIYYSLGANNYIKSIDEDLKLFKYETPSKNKLALLNGQGATTSNNTVNKPVTSNNNGVGSLKGNITWQYNKFIGTKPDVGATIILFPTNMKKVTTAQIIAVEDGKAEASSIGIYYAQVDGFGSYEITDLPAGNYFALYQSSKTLRNYLEPVNSDVYKNLKQYVSDYDDGDFGIDIFNHMVIDLTIKNKEVKTISKDWGYSY